MYNGGCTCIVAANECIVAANEFWKWVAWLTKAGLKNKHKTACSFYLKLLENASSRIATAHIKVKIFLTKLQEVLNLRRH